jgi:hypothetical protein
MFDLLEAKTADQEVHYESKCKFRGLKSLVSHQPGRIKVIEVERFAAKMRVVVI